MSAKCFFSKDCDNCKLQREEVRQPLEGKSYIVKSCVFHIQAEHVENQTRMMFNMQAELGELKNAFTMLSLALLGIEGAKEEVLKKAYKQLGQQEKDADTPENQVSKIRQG